MEVGEGTGEEHGEGEYWMTQDERLRTEGL